MSTELTTSVAHAAELARSGRYDEAERELRTLGGRDSTDPAVLDLLARIHAQRGELLDADECWALALRLDAGFSPARAGRQRIAALVARRLRPRPGRVVLAVALVAVAVTGAGVAGALLTEEPPPGPDPTVLAELDDVQRGQREQAERVEDLDDRLDRAGSDQRVLDDLAAALADEPAMTVRTEGDTLVVTFPTGVFEVGVRLSDQGAAALADLVGELGPFVADVAVTVVGHTEDARVSSSLGYSTNAELGQARAVVAAERMARAGGVPLATFALASSGAADPPFPNTTQEGREKNRTVTVVIRPR